MLNLLEKICQILDALQIPYMLSGSVAMNFYAEPRMTQDIDIVVEMQDYDVSSFVKMLEDKFYYFQEGIYDEIRRKGMFNIIDLESGFKVDFIIMKKDLFKIGVKQFM
jgi:DNA polymerase/3'-5' exonuclease PolX